MTVPSYYYQDSPPPLPTHNDHIYSSPPYPTSYTPSPNLYSSSSTTPQFPYDDEYDQEKKFIPKQKRKRSCMDKLCCGCCTCCPKWMRWCTCLIFIIIVLLGIAAGVLVALFKIPNVQFLGLEQDPQFSFTDQVLNINFNVDISVDNQNFESITFDTIKANAYYPSPYNVYIGGGSVQNVHISSYAITNITFPFQVALNSSDTKQQGVLMDLVTRCGLDGSTPESIKFNYYIYPTVKVAGISITPKISKSMSLACPTAELSSLLGGLFNGNSIS